MKDKINLKVIFQTFCFIMMFLLLKEAYAEHFFQKHNTWYETIPANPIIAKDSANYVNDILINSNRLYVTYNEWSMPIWQADSNTPITTIEMLSPDKICGSNAIANGWNKVPIPSNAKSAGMDELCQGKSRDGHMIILSHDGKWEWDFYRARNCGDGWKASCIRKRARTIAASEEGIGLGDGSGILPVFQVFPNTYSQDDVMGMPRACGVSAHSQGLITYNDYQKGFIDHAIQFGYNSEKKHTGYFRDYPCLYYGGGTCEREHAMFFGSRLQLNPSYNCNQHSNSLTKMICEALKKYGAIFVINTGPSYNSLYLESTYGKSNFWSGIIENPLPIPINQLKVIEPVCSDCSICPNCTVQKPVEKPEVAPAAPTIIEIK
ncbi:MAG: hypothetical protein IBX72_06160 [Nitrospirae bacterium]|nr:hypothetical protein [Nitrospirota bacterium]